MYACAIPNCSSKGWEPNDTSGIWFFNIQNVRCDLVWNSSLFFLPKMYRKPNEKPKKKSIQGSLLNWFKKDDTIVEKKEKTLNMKSSLLEIVSTKLPFLKSSSSKSNTVDTIVQNTSVNIHDEIEIVTAGQTLNRETRRISQVDHPDYPSSKKSVDGKTLYQKSLSRPPNTSGNQCIF